MPRPKYEIIVNGRVATSDDGTSLVFPSRGAADKEVRRFVKEWRRSKARRTALVRCVAFRKGEGELFGFVLKDRGNIVGRVYSQKVR